MPIKAEMRWFYPIDWPQLSNHIRFERARGVCQRCGRPHGEIVRCLLDGRWYDETRQTWRNHRGRPVHQPDIEEAARMRQTRVILAAAHLDHDPSNNRLKNLRGWCQHCHLLHDRPYHLVRRRITYLLRRALGDLFLGPTLAEQPKNGTLLGTYRAAPAVVLKQRPMAASRQIRTVYMRALNTPMSGRATNTICQLSAVWMTLRTTPLTPRPARPLHPLIYIR